MKIFMKNSIEENKIYDEIFQRYTNIINEKLGKKK